MGNTYKLPRGTTWPVTFLVTKSGKPVNLLGYRALVTVRKFIVDGTVDSVSPPVWQGDTAASGASLAIPPSTVVWTAGESVTTSTVNVPPTAEVTGYFYQCTTAGSGATASLATEWPIPPAGALPGDPEFAVQSTPDANGVVWTCAGLVNMISAVMPPSATQALPNPPAGSGVPLFYDVVVDDGAGDVFQTEDGVLRMTPRIGLSQP